MTEVFTFIGDALEYSVFAAPRKPGLSTAEILEVGSRLGYREGEIKDGLRALDRQEGGRWIPNLYLTSTFLHGNDPEYRDIAAFDFVVNELRGLARELGAARAVLDRDTLVARAAAEGLNEDAVEAAVAVYLLGGHLLAVEDGLRLAPGREMYALPSVQAAGGGIKVTQPRVRARETMAAVVDVVRRRSDGRLAASEPRKAFGQALEGLGHGRFRVWWSSTDQELRLADPRQPMTVCVLAASLAEGALTFLVARARALNLGPMGGRTFEGPSTRWRFDDLLAGAAAGGTNAVVDEDTRRRAKHLNDVRQRIHPGRLLDENPTGPIPDLRPEESREALITLDRILRSVLDWLAAHPPSAPT